MKAEKYISSGNIASVYAASGKKEKAIEWLATALEERDPNLTWIKFDREFKFLEPDPRFQTILRKVKLAEKSFGSPEKPPLNKSRRRLFLALGVLLLTIFFAGQIFILPST
jgi:hypothetical protein